MFIVYPLNIDYLIDDVRLHIGDIDDDGSKTAFSNSVIRTALINGVKGLQRRWDNRYLVYNERLLVTNPQDLGYTIPSGYVLGRLPQGYGTMPDGLRENDIFRNPF